jgi:hypothetical protein
VETPPRTIAFVAVRGDAVQLAADAGLAAEDVRELVASGEESVDELQDLVYGGEVERILIPNAGILGPDVMAQEMIISGWIERGVSLFAQDGDEGEARRQARNALGEIDEYGKIPWVP